MFDLVDFVLRFSYYYARLMGVLNFEIDLQSGRSSISHKATIYAVLVNVFIFCFLPLQLLRSDNINVAWAQANRLHVQVFVIMTKIRLVGVLLSLLSRWRQRHELRCLLRGFRQLFLTKPQVKKLYRRGVISKCIFDTLAELFQMFVELDAQRQPFSLELCLNLSLMYFLTALLNSIVAQYFFGMLHVHAHYMLLNLELSRLLSEIRSINKVNARRHNVGIFMSKCCALADQLDEIAVTQSKLQRLVEQMSKIFGLQSFCIFSTYYLSSVATIYFTFCAFKYSASGLDNLLVIFAHLYTLDAHDKMLKLMEERCLYPTGLDQRLETAFESFQLQLARNPLKITVLGLFDLNRCCVITMIASLLSNTIILIQYDIKNY
ncbi:putative gustatory receptor 59d [Drosophila tropicalis]|uniref:putative gustatory receptor 59d n=1 Tax=Drosophila tropicalis TaxID=46794 RepID=UPI0035AB6B36